MITKKRLVILISLIAVVLCSVGIVLSFTSKPDTKEVFAAELVFEQTWEQEGGALLDDTFIVPTGAKIKIAENVFVEPESGVLFFPDGTAKTLDSKLLNMLGKYTIRYIAHYENNEYYAEKDFYVRESNYKLSDSVFSSAEFKSADTLSNNQFMPTQQAGIDLTLSKDNYFRFSKSIDLYEHIDSDGLVNVCTVYPELDSSLTDPDGYGEAYAHYFIVKLIDSYNENNYVEFYFWGSRNDYYSNGELKRATDAYVGAGASNQTYLTGQYYNGTKDLNYEIDGTYYRMFFSERYQRTPYGTFAGNQSLKVYNSGGVSFKFDLNTNKVYFVKNGATGSFSENRFVTDLDNENVYPDNPFKGFTTGEVYVQFEVQRFEDNVSSVDMQITNICGLKGDELKKEVLVDEKVPRVDIDVVYTNEEEKSVNAVCNEDFIIPTATVYDVNGDNKYKVSVYTDYFSNEPKLVNVQNGKFKPSKVGTVYTIVYTAKDYSENYNIDKVTGKSLDYINVIPINAEKFTFRKDIKASGFASSTLSLIPEIPVTSINKGVTTTLFVVEPTGKRIDITDSYNEGNYSFMPECLGTYKVEFVFADNLYSQTYSYDVHCADSGVVLFNQKISVPDIFIKDALYDLETYKVLIATENGLEEREGVLLISEDGGEYKAVADQHNFKTSATQTISFKVQYGDKQSSFVKECKIANVNYALDANVNNGELIYKDYFLGYDNVAVTDSNFKYTFNAGKATNLQFATPLYLNDFSLEFEISEEQQQIDSFSLVFNEISYMDRGYTITYKKVAEDAVALSIVDKNGKAYLQETSTKSNFYGTHSISIRSSKVTFSEGEVVSIDNIKTNYVNFAITTGVLANPFTLNISSICGTTLSEYVSKRPAQIVFERPMGASFIGQNFTLPEFYVSSAFDPVIMSKLTYSFKNNDGVYLVDVNGKEIKNVSALDGAYTINAKDNSTYKFEFNYDGLFVKLASPYVISSTDITAPVVVFENGANQNTCVEITVGTVHDFKTFTVSDNISAIENITTKWVIYDCNLVIQEWDYQETSYQFNKVGVYRIGILAQDEKMNTVYSYYNVVVK